jgi:hypothetical protein
MTTGGGTTKSRPTHRVLGEMVLREGRGHRHGAVLRLAGCGNQVRQRHGEAHSGHGGGEHLVEGMEASAAGRRA